MDIKELENILGESIGALKPVPYEPTDVVEYEEITLDRTEKDNSRWLVYISSALEDAKSFEIHCWNEETEWINWLFDMVR